MHDEHDLVELGIVQCLFDFFKCLSHIQSGVIEVPLNDALDEVEENTGTYPISEIVCMFKVPIAYVGLCTFDLTTKCNGEQIEVTSKPMPTV